MSKNLLQSDSAEKLSTERADRYDLTVRSDISVSSLLPSSSNWQILEVAKHGVDLIGVRGLCCVQLGCVGVVCDSIVCLFVLCLFLFLSVFGWNCWLSVVFG